MTRLLSLVLSIPPRSYDDRKVSGQCARRGCEAECQEEHLLCAGHADEHRARNRKTMKRTRRWRRVQGRLWG
jgi:hypothetical protein